MSTTTDRLLSRRVTWDGAVIRDDSPDRGDGRYRHYYRITHSVRDPETGAWTIDGFDHLGPRRPDGPVYRYDGTTWDLPAIATTVFPVWTSILAALVAVLCWPMGYAAFGNYEASMFVFLGCFTVPLWNWFYNVEPVRGTKVAAAYEAAHVAAQVHYRAEQKQYQAQSNAAFNDRITADGGTFGAQGQVIFPGRNYDGSQG